MVRVKSNLDGDIHRFVLPDSPTFKELHDHLAAIYGTTDFTVKYKDDEGDHVTVSSDEELLEAVSSVPDSGLLRVEVLRSTAPPSAAAPRNVTTTPTPQPATEPAPAAQPTASTSAGAGPSSNPNPTRDDDNSGGMRDTLTPEDVMQGLGGMFAGLFGPFGMGGGGMCGMSGFPGGMGSMGGGGFPGGMGSMGGGGFPGGMGGMGGGGFRGGMRGAGWGRGRNRFGGAQPFGMPWMNFNTEDIGRFMREFDPQAIGGDFANIQPSTMEALRNLVAHFVRQPNLVDTMQALGTAMPLLHGFVAELGSGAPVTPARVDALATAVNATLAARLGADNARRVADFVRTAASDAAVQSILRRIPSGMGMGGGDSNEGSTPAPRAANEGTQHPWENEPDRPLVPRPTLSMGSRGTEVLFLQHLLTNLGYMTPADYRLRAGVFGPRTAAAVTAFRRDCGLPPTPFPVYDDVVAASLLSLIDVGVPPTAATGASSQPTDEGPAVDVDNAPTAA